MCPRVFQVPPPTLGIRVIGVNMIHGVPDKLNIYVKRVLEGSVAGLDGRIRVNDHIVEVRNEDHSCRYIIIQSGSGFRLFGESLQVFNNFNAEICLK
jgi:hypothetical protein